MPTPQKATGDLRIMTWNIQNLGPRKLACPSIMNCIANTITAYDVDIFIVVELRNVLDLIELSNILSNNRTTPNYRGYFYSPASKTSSPLAISQGNHYEYYGILVKDANTVQPYGFIGPLSDPNYFVTSAATANLNQLTLTSNFNANGQFGNSFYLYDRLFPYGRPPGWIQFNYNNNVFNIMPVHLAPNLKFAGTQVQRIANFDLTQSIADTLIITGDFNTESQQLLDRKTQNNLNQQIAAYLEQYQCYASFTRKLPTHVNGSVYDNFYTRGNGNTFTNATIVPYKNVADIFLTLPNAQNDLLNYVQAMTTVNQKTIAINKLFNNIVLNDEEYKAIYGLVSDHFPITIDIGFTR